MVDTSRLRIVYVHAHVSNAEMYNHTYRQIIDWQFGAGIPFVRKWTTNVGS